MIKRGDVGVWVVGVDGARRDSDVGCVGLVGVACSSNSYDLSVTSLQTLGYRILALELNEVICSDGGSISSIARRVEIMDSRVE